MFSEQDKGHVARRLLENLQKCIGGLHCQRFRLRDEADLAFSLNRGELRYSKEFANLRDANLLFLLGRGQFEQVSVDAASNEGLIVGAPTDQWSGELAADCDPIALCRHKEERYRAVRDRVWMLNRC